METRADLDRVMAPSKCYNLFTFEVNPFEFSKGAKSFSETFSSSTSGRERETLSVVPDSSV